MDSINRNQPEHNRDDLKGPAAVSKIKELIDKSKTCFFCTSAATGDSSGTRPMTVQEVDDRGSLWFLSASDSHLDLEIKKDPLVRLYFQGSARSDFLQLTGRASLSTDKAKIKQLWNPLLKTWFTEGIDDPRITVIQVTPWEGYYWDTKHGIAIASVKMLIGAATGKTLDDSVEGRLLVARS